MILGLLTIINGIAAMAGLALALGLWSLTGNREIDLHFAITLNTITFAVAVLCVLADRSSRKAVRQ